MVCGGDEEFEDEIVGGADQEGGGDLGGSSSEAVGLAGGDGRRSGGLMERLRCALGGDEEGADLLIQNDGRGGGVLQWLQALDLQVMGACRADERLKPLLKLNVSSGVAEDLLLTHLTQHFEATEVVLLARCLCVPLVSIRVGKVIKQGTILSPTACRGHLNFTLLPSSDLCITFVGDDGCTERLAVLNSNYENMTACIEEISADISGRSFLIKLPRDQVLYFWSAERSLSLGSEMLVKMKDLLKTRPTLSQLTRISERRLGHFATHLRAHLLLSNCGSQSDSTSLLPSESESPESDSNLTSLPHASSLSQSSCSHQLKARTVLHHDCSSSETNSSMDWMHQRSSIEMKTGSKEKFGLADDNNFSDEAICASTFSLPSGQTSSSISSEDGQLQGHKISSLLPLSFPETFGPSVFPSIGSLSFSLPSAQVPIISPSPLFSPYYCWCPPCTSTLQYTVTSPNLSPSPADSLILPPLSSLLSARSSTSATVTTTKPIVDLVDTPALDFPSFITDPLVQLPLPVSSFITVSSSQHLPSFTPFVADPIVHIPVIDVCSSGQGYLVSAGPALSTTISPLLPNLIKCPIVPESDSVLEKGARDTLRLLINSSQTGPPFLDRLPPVFTAMDDNHSCVHATKLSMLATGSRGFYSGTRDVDANANGLSALGGVSLLGGADDKKRDRRQLPLYCDAEQGDLKDKLPSEGHDEADL